MTAPFFVRYYAGIAELSRRDNNAREAALQRQKQQQRRNR